MTEPRAALWLGHGVLSADEAWRRSGERVAAARDMPVGEAATGELIGVSTAFATWCALLDLPMYFLRLFVAPSHGHPQVARELLAESARTLRPERPPTAADAPRGVWLEIQNPKIDRAIRDLVWRVRGLDFTCVGCSASRAVSRAHYYPGRCFRIPMAFDNIPATLRLPSLLRSLPMHALTPSQQSRRSASILAASSAALFAPITVAAAEALVGTDVAMRDDDTASVAWGRYGTLGRLPQSRSHMRQYASGRLTSAQRYQEP